MLKNILLTLAWLFIFGGLVIVACFLIIAHNDGYVTGFSKLDYNFTPKFFETIGSIIGPIISASGFFFLYLNFREQQNIRHIDKLESKFYQLVKFHRDNVSEMTLSYYEKKRNAQNENDLELVTAENRKVFKLIHDQFESLYNELKFLFEDKRQVEIYDSDYLEKLKCNSTIRERGIDLTVYAKLDILYLITYFGANKDGINTILQITKDKYQQEFIDLVLNFACFKPKRESRFWNDWVANFSNTDDFVKSAHFRQIISQKQNFVLNGERLESHKSEYQKAIVYGLNSFEKYYSGHQFRLGHYFRNLFQAFMCIHVDKILTYTEKKEYTKVLKAQLSTFELVIFFISSVSQLGRSWELERKINPEIAVDFDYQLITLYNIIRNLPNRELIDGIKYSSFYPLVSYETYDENEAREKRKLFNARL